MMAISVQTLSEELLSRYLVFSDVETGRIDLAIRDAMQEVSARVWGNMYSRGVCALAAHMLYASGAENDGTPLRIVTSQSADGISQSYGGALDDDEIKTSGFGQEYLRLRKLHRMHMLVT